MVVVQLNKGFERFCAHAHKRTKERTRLKWPFQAINRHNRDMSSTIRHIPIALEPSKAQRLRSSVFLRPSADALNGGPQQTLCEESVVRLLSLTMGSAIESLHCQGH